MSDVFLLYLFTRLEAIRDISIFFVLFVGVPSVILMFVWLLAAAIRAQLRKAAK